MQKEAWRERVMQDGGVIPATGFPWVDAMATGTCKKHVRHVANASISCNICIRPRAVVLGGIPSKHTFRGGRFEVEVVVHGSSWEVVAHVAA